MSAVLLFIAAITRTPGAQADYVVMMSLDGLGAKYLQFYLTNAPAQFPNFVRLTNEGSYTFNARCDYDASITIPNHITMFTGRPVLQSNGTAQVQHGITTDAPTATQTIHNSGNTTIPYKASFFDIAHDHGFSTGIYLGKMRLQICERSYNAANGAADAFPEIAGDNGNAKLDSGLTATNADLSTAAGISNEVNAIVRDFTNSAPKRCNFIHLAEPDLTGHGSGWNSANWSNMVRNVDAQIGRILAAISNNPALSNRTAFIITADHGGFGNSHTDNTQLTNYTIPFFFWGPGFPAGRDAYDLFVNRGNPGTNRPSYAVSPQPLRNGDIGNIGLSLLGLPPITDSFIVPLLNGTNAPLNVARGTDGSCTMWWPSNATAFVLESAPALPSLGQWQQVTNGIVNNGGVLTFVASPTNASKFYRLRKL